MYNYTKYLATIACSTTLCWSQIPRQGKELTILPQDLPLNSETPNNITYGSIWNVYYTALTKLYKSNIGTYCRIVKTNNNYTIKVTAFSKNFVYVVKNQPGELNFKSTEYNNISKTVRQVYNWNFVTFENTASSTCTVETSNLN